MTKTWTKHYKNGFGSADRIQRNAYAYAVAMVMTGGRHMCPTCEGPLDFGTAEVDRVNGSERDANGSEVYREGSIVYVCRGCNQGRSALQSIGRDWTDAHVYAQHVADASAMVTMPSIREAREWWENREVSTARVSRYA